MIRNIIYLIVGGFPMMSILISCFTTATEVQNHYCDGGLIFILINQQ